MTRKPLARNAMYTLLCAGFVVLAGCNQSPTPAQGPASSASAASATSAPAPTQTTAAQASPYTPPTADQLYQMVAPIALFPDNLVAQVLAGSTYPDQITAADNLLTQNPGLKGDPLLAQVNPQPWDASVKALTTFPSVLDQMAKNVQWTTALGEAYVNDPSDVMNAIQVMRQRASKQGNLRSTAQQRIQTQAAVVTDNSTYASDGQEPVYDGPSVVEAPPQTIEILPAQSDTVYVPSYDPQTVYGDEVPYYPSYSYEEPRGYSTGEIVTAGAVSFGVGILVGSLLEHHHHRDNYDDQPGGGWHSWGMNWGGRQNGGGGWQRPAVVHNNTTYVSNSTTVVNRYTTNNINNSRTTINNGSNNRSPIAQNRNPGAVNNPPVNAPPGAAANGRPPVVAPRGVVSMPHFGPNATQRGAPGPQGPHALPGSPGNGRPNVVTAPHGPMTMPHFNKTPVRGAPAQPQQPGVHGLAHAPNNLVPRPGVTNPTRGMPHVQPVHTPIAAPNHAAPRPLPGAQPPHIAPSRNTVAPGMGHAVRPVPQTGPTARPAQTPRPAASRPAMAPRPAASRPAFAPRPATAPRQEAAPRPAVAPRPMAPRPAATPRPQQAPQRPQVAPHAAARPAPARTNDKRNKDDKHDHP